MKKIRRLLRLLLPYLLILLILAAGLCGSFFLIRHATIYDTSIVRHDAPDSRLLFVDAKEPLLLYPWDKIADHDSERYSESVGINDLDEASAEHLRPIICKLRGGRECLKPPQSAGCNLSCRRAPLR